MVETYFLLLRLHVLGKRGMSRIARDYALMLVNPQCFGRRNDDLHAKFKYP